MTPGGRFLHYTKCLFLLPIDPSNTSAITTNLSEEITTFQSPKLSEKSVKPIGIENSPPTGSETSRSFQPEGKVSKFT